jgi:enamine deaminase RidA (YjgF/YER057c/UK114 family)
MPSQSLKILLAGAAGAAALLLLLQRRHIQRGPLRKAKVASAPAPLAAYVNAVLTPAACRTLYISGQFGARSNGEIALTPEQQCRLCFANIESVLRHHRLGWEHVAKVTVFLTADCPLSAYHASRADFMGDIECASSLVFVAALANQDMLVEIEAVAAAPLEEP